MSTAVKKFVKKGRSPVAKGATPKRAVRFVVDLAKPAEDEVVSVAQVHAHLLPGSGLVNYKEEEFFRKELKVGKNGLKGVFPSGNLVKIVAKDGQVVIESSVHIAKSYVKFVVRRFLAKSHLAQYLRVLAPSKDTIEIRYIRLAEEEGEAEAEESA